MNPDALTFQEIILALQNYWAKQGCVVLQPYDSENIYVIGGESIYRQLLPYCDTAHVTKVCNAYQADTWFPNLDESSEWEITGESEEQTYFDLEYYFLRYERKKESPAQAL